MKNTSKSLKRLLSMVMVLAMILSMLPMTALAADSQTKTIYLNAGGSNLCLPCKVQTLQNRQGFLRMKHPQGNISPAILL